MTTLHIRREALKFSAAHFTIFPDGTKEPLHGHNYQVSLDAELRSSAFESMVSFGDLKEPLRALCEAWDEKVLLPARSRFVTRGQAPSGSVALTACGKSYLFPADEVVWVEAETVASETLAEGMLAALVRTLPEAARKGLRSLSLRIEESPGQGATARQELG